MSTLADPEKLADELRSMSRYAVQHWGRVISGICDQAADAADELRALRDRLEAVRRVLDDVVEVDHHTEGLIWRLREALEGKP
jgi:hypothetical protein